ncbi:MAG: pitrilysin family protein [Bacteroidota bacterium]
MSGILYETFTLDNGLKVIVHEDHSLAKAVVNVIYRVGAKDEDPNRTGFAHLFEHLMFGGSKHITDYDTPLQKVGGENNAFTTNDLTNYYLTLPSNQLETGFWLESDRMLELDFSQRNLDVQKSVVIEEFKQRYLNKPYGDAHLILRSVHFKKHPYQWPTIGKEISHIEGATLEEVKKFFYGFYAPNNATLVVAGDVTVPQVRALAEKWFGPIPRRELLTRELPREPKQSAPREKTVYRDVPFPAVYKMFHIPSKKDPAYFAADMMTDIMSGGKAGHLYQHVVKEKQVASSAAAFSWGAHHPGIISIDGTVARGKTVEAYETALKEVIESLYDLSESELQRVKNSIESQYVMERTTLLNKAMVLAICDTLGDPELANTSLDHYLAVTRDQVVEAAQTLLHPDNCSTLYYLPQNGKADAES